MQAYFKPIYWTVRTLTQGLAITLKHIFAARKRHSPTNVTYQDYFSEKEGIVTLQYPKEAIPVPDHGRYRLHNEIEDCIVCDKCAVICPVDCIAIEAIKSPTPIGETSDGSVKRLYAAVFDIDMAKCCYCGLCTTVCPTECLTMTKVYDYSEFDIRNMNYHFSNLTPEMAAEKKVLYEKFIAEKEALKAQQKSETTALGTEPPKPKPVFKPVIGTKTISNKPIENKENTSDGTASTLQLSDTEALGTQNNQVSNEKHPEKSSSSEAAAPKPKTVFKPVIKPPVTSNLSEKKDALSASDDKEDKTEEKPKVVFKPIIKPPKKKDE